MLCYHAVSDSWRSPLAVTTAQLDAQLGLLAERGFRGITFSEAVEERGRGRRVAITFDDGYRSVARLAQPILARHGMPATVFLPTDFVGREEPMSWPGIDEWLDRPQASELVPVSWEEAGGLAAAGWEIGSHSRTHPHLTRLGDEQLSSELAESRAECERRLGLPCRSLAFPYGDTDQRVMRAAASAGYAAAAGLSSRIEQPWRLNWPRVGVYPVDGERSFRLKISRPMRRLQRSRLWSSLEPVVGALRGGASAVA